MNINKLNDTGYELLSDLWVQKLVELSKDQIDIIFSLQGQITRADTNQWKVKNKKKAHGKLNLDKLKITLEQNK